MTIIDDLLKAKEAEKKSEPVLILAGDSRVLLNGVPPKCDCRVVAEERYQEMIADYAALTERVRVLQATINQAAIQLRFGAHQNALKMLDAALHSPASPTGQAQEAETG